MKQTVVEWLQEAFESSILDKEQIMQVIGLFEQAKEMEKEQIINAYQQAEKDNGKDFLNGDLYYDETFKTRI